MSIIELSNEDKIKLKALAAETYKLDKVYRGLYGEPDVNEGLVKQVGRLNKGQIELRQMFERHQDENKLGMTKILEEVQKIKTVNIRRDAKIAGASIGFGTVMGYLAKAKGLIPAFFGKLF